MNRILFFIVLLMVTITPRASSQPRINVDGRFTITVINEKRQLASGVTVTLVNTEDKTTLKTMITNENGEVQSFFIQGKYTCII